MASLLQVCLLSAAVVLLGLPCHAIDVMVPMRDGVKLHTEFDFPLASLENLSAMLDRSPYGPWHTEALADLYLLLGFAGVKQDMRGTQTSEGNFTVWHDAANDSFDTMKYITSQFWSNGKVYTVGASADGIASFCEVINRPQWLQAQFIIFATAQGRNTFFPGGAYQKQLIEKWLKGTVPSQADDLIELIKSNEGPGDWWSPINETSQIGKVSFPSVHWGGWYDIFLRGHLFGFYMYQYLAEPAWRGQAKMVIDPCGHCQDVAKHFTKNLIDGRVGLPVLLSFDLFAGKPPVENVKELTFYIMGGNETDAPGNYWTTLHDWPTFTPTPYYFTPDNRLSPTPPPMLEGEEAGTTYTYDPSNPVPTLGGNNLFGTCGPKDQQPVENRTDVLLFTSDVLSAPLWVTGPLDAHIYVASSAVDTDFTVKLTDVFPSGESRLIQDGVVRMRWRDDVAVPQLLTPGQVYGTVVSLWNTSYVFNAGHRIRVAVSSSNFPRYDTNPNNGLPLTQDGPVVVAKNTIYHSGQYPSSIVLPVVTPSQMPEINILKMEAEMEAADPARMALARKVVERTVARVQSPALGSIPLGNTFRP